MTDDNASEAGKLLAEVFGDDMLAQMQGGNFTCSEADNIATALIMLGQPDAAATWLEGHSLGDDSDEDSHHLGDGDDAEELARSHVKMLAATNGLAIDQWLEVPDDLTNEPPANSVRTSAENVQEGQRIKVWAYTDDDPWPGGRAGFHEGRVEVVETQPMVPDGTPAVHIKFTDGRWVHAIRYAVTHIVREG